MSFRPVIGERDVDCRRTQVFALDLARSRKIIDQDILDESFQSVARQRDERLAYRGCSLFPRLQEFEDLPAIENSGIEGRYLN